MPQFILVEETMAHTRLNEGLPKWSSLQCSCSFCRADPTGTNFGYSYRLTSKY